MSDSKSDYYFFWKPNAPGGWASQWYPSPFKARIIVHTASGINIVYDEETEYDFPTAEHWMMACKAALFGDTAVLTEVLALDAHDMAAVKALGRRVSPFDAAQWDAVREEVVFVGNMHKFGQSAELRGILEGTGEKELVEASPRDRIWGIGFGERNAMGVRERWGLNLLGKALMRVREALRAESQSVSAG